MLTRIRQWWTSRTIDGGGKGGGKEEGMSQFFVFLFSLISGLLDLTLVHCYSSFFIIFTIYCFLFPVEFHWVHLSLVIQMTLVKLCAPLQLTARIVQIHQSSVHSRSQRRYLRNPLMLHSKERLAWRVYLLCLYLGHYLFNHGKLSNVFVFPFKSIVFLFIYLFQVRILKS
jgi:hypothetical protein